MRVKAEIFKGIEFVRISSLPNDQKEKIWQSFQHDKIIKIVKDNALLNDCILYHDYVNWADQQRSVPTSAPAPEPTNPAPVLFGKLAYK
ncbi:MAG: hypothetical protein K2U26_00365 [Cyclobacteriaceae bacterium]|nr:hypothetical protein [Cyclobacteriaceae bacterium]